MTEAPYRPRLWHVVAIAMLAAFELLALWQVLHPHVADDYRAYYIERTSSCFPRITSSYYPLGEPVSFVPGRSGYKRDTIRWCGFMPPDKAGIRSFGDYGILRMKFPMPDSDLLFTYTSFANTSSGKPARDVDLVVNGVHLATITYADAGRVAGKVVIPEAVAKSGSNGLEIQFVVPRIAPPGTNSEPVTLQVRLEAVRVSAIVDAKEAEPGPASSSSQ